MTRTKTRALANWPNNAVSVLDFGAVGDGVTDDTAAISAGIEEAASKGYTLFFPPGTYKASSTFVITINDSIAIEGHDATIDFVGSPKSYAFFLNWTSPINSASISGLNIKGNNLIATAIRMSSSTDDFAESLSIKNCQIQDLIKTGSVTTSAIGIYMAEGVVAEVSGCSIVNVTRTIPGACTGIAIVACRQTLINNNYIKNITWGTDTANKIDADGIKYFNETQNGLYSRDNATIMNNTVIDCSGRFVKMQCGGSVNVCNNLFRIESAIELIQNWKAFDIQNGDCDVHDNEVILGDLFTGAASGTIFTAQSPKAENILYDYEPFHQKFHNNTIKINQDFPYGVIFGRPTAGAKYLHTVDIIDNQFLANQPLAPSSDVSFANLSTFLYTQGGEWPDPADMESNYVWNVKGNFVACYYLSKLNGNINAGKDYANKWFLHYNNNTKTPYKSGSNQLISSDDHFTSTMQVSDSFAGIYCSFDFKQLLAGCNFYIGGGASVVPINGPANKTYRTCVTSQQGIQVYNTNSFYLSGDSAENWSGNLNTVFRSKLQEAIAPSVDTADLVEPDEEQVSTADLTNEEQGD